MSGDALTEIITRRLSWASLHWFPVRSRGGIKSPTIAPEIAPEIAKAIVASDWLDAVKAEAGRAALRDAANAIDSGDVDHEDLRQAGVNEIATLGWSDKSVIDAHDSGSVWRDWLRARADQIGVSA